MTLSPSQLFSLSLPLLAVCIAGGVTSARAADVPPRSPTVVYVDPNGGLFKASKRLLAAPCWTIDTAGTMDYGRCCPDGFSAVGVTVEGNLACLVR